MTTPTQDSTAERLPYGGTVRDLRVQIGRLAVRGERVFERTLLESGTPMNAAEREANLMAHGASFHGYALAGVLALIADRDPAMAFEAAAMVQSIGADGGAEWCDDIWDDIKDAGAPGEPAKAEQTAAVST